MPEPTVYLETSVVAYGTSRPSRDVIVAGQQPMTGEWLAFGTAGYELFISQFVMRDASTGNPSAA